MFIAIQICLLLVLTHALKYPDSKFNIKIMRPSSSLLKLTVINLLIM